MVVTLSAELEKMVNARMASGHYESVSDLFQTALDLLEEQQERHGALRQDIAQGLEQLDRGERRRLDIEAIKRKALEQHRLRQSA